ncbi:MAG: hypothetical protein ABIS14_10875 [Sphingomonas sp.]
MLIFDRGPITRAMLRAILEPRAGSVAMSSTVGETLEHLRGGGIATLLIDDTTIKASGDVMAVLAELVDAARRVGARVALLWSGLEDVQRTTFAALGIDLIIQKPIAGPALAAALFPVGKSDDLPPNNLVTQAA